METISIPNARKILKKWAIEWDKPELLELANKMYRRPPKFPKARAERSGLTIELAKKIREYKRLNPSMANRDIGEKFGVDGGRVSEAIHMLEKKNG